MSYDEFTKDHRLFFPTALQHPNEDAWVYSCICDDCKRVMNMKFHGADVRKIGERSFAAIWERGCKATFEDTLCIPFVEPAPLEPELPLALQEPNVVEINISDEATELGHDTV